MQRSGRCKCGAILTFDQGPDGYKGRCDRCGSMVRLRTAGAAADPANPASSRIRPPRPSDPRLSVVALRQPGPAVPGAPDPDATAPFEPIDEVVLEPWPARPVAPPARSVNWPMYGLIFVVGLIALIAGGVGAGMVFWFWSR